MRVLTLILILLGFCQSAGSEVIINPYVHGGSLPEQVVEGFVGDYPDSEQLLAVVDLTAGVAINAFRVQRSSDSTQQDIPFDETGQLDVQALMDFVGTGATDQGHVVTWYDQSGNANYTEESLTTVSPQIVRNGALIHNGGIPALEFAPNHSMTSFQTTDPNGRVNLTMMGVVAPDLVDSSFANNAFYGFGESGGWGAVALKSNNAEVLVRFGTSASGSDVEILRTNTSQTLEAITASKDSVSGNVSISLNGGSPTTEAQASAVAHTETTLMLGNVTSGTYNGQIFAVGLWYTSYESSIQTMGDDLETLFSPQHWLNTAHAVYGLVRLVDGYTGPAIRIFRDSDDTELDIDFLVGGGLDTTAILNFVGAANAYVVAWYDQTPNERHAYTAGGTSSPVVAASGAMITDYAGNHALDFNGGSTHFTTAENANWLEDGYTLVAGVSDLNGTHWTGTNSSASGSTAVHIGESGSAVGVKHFSNDATFSRTNQTGVTEIHAATWRGASAQGSFYHVDGVQIGTTNATTPSALNTQNGGLNIGKGWSGNTTTSGNITFLVSLPNRIEEQQAAFSDWINTTYYSIY